MEAVDETTIFSTKVKMSVVVISLVTMQRGRLSSSDSKWHERFSEDKSPLDESSETE
jgi:hypothetical protein